MNVKKIKTNTPATNILAAVIVTGVKFVTNILVAVTLNPHAATTKNRIK